MSNTIVMDALPTKKPTVLDLSKWSVKKYNKFKKAIEALNGSQPVVINFGGIEYLDAPMIELLKDLVIRVYSITTVHIDNYENIQPQLEAVGIFPFFLKK